MRHRRQPHADGLLFKYNANAHQGKSVDLDIKNLHLSIGHFVALAFVLLIGLQVGAEPLQLKGPLRVVTIIHLIQAWNT